MADSPSATDPLVARLRSACEELERRLLAGESCRAEDYFKLHPELSSTDSLALPLIQAEWSARRRRGEHPDSAELIRRFPQWADRLQLMLGETSSRASNQATLPDSRSGERNLPPTPPAGLPAAGPEVPPRSLDHLEIVAPLGRGGMGIVYQVWDPVMRRHVALKRLKNGSLADEQEVARFYREARAAGRLRHPNLVAVHDLGLFRGEHAFTMDLLTGGTLADHAAEYRDPRRAAHLIEKVALAVHAVHERGIVHRDLKPSNIFFDERGEPLVGDFGLAKVREPDVELTQSGVMLGTPAYMAPEQFPDHPGEVGPRSDVWALGVILYELVTGARPFRGTSYKELARQVCRHNVPAPRQRRPDLDRALERVILTCLTRSPHHRYRSAADLADDLGRWLRGGRVLLATSPDGRRQGRRRRLAVALLLALVLLLGLTAFLLRPDGGGASPPGPPVLPDAVPQPQRLVLIGETGDPLRPPLEKVGTPAPNVPAPPDGTFCLATEGYYAVLLARPPWPSYRFEAEARQEGADDRKGRSVGLVFGHLRLQPPATPCESFFTLSFTEFGQGRRKVGLALRGSYLSRGAWKEGPYRDLGDVPSGWTPVPRTRARGDWRRLAIEVTPEEVRFLWSALPDRQELKEEVRTIPAPELLRSCREQFTGVLDFRKDDHLQYGLGVQVTQARACFRRVSVTELKPR
jgi:serine/threonine-protein kinase